MEEENTYIVSLIPLKIKAKSPEEAESKADTLINNGEVQVKSVDEV